MSPPQPAFPTWSTPGTPVHPVQFSAQPFCLFPFPFSFPSLLSVPLPLTHLFPGGLGLVAEHRVQQVFRIYLLSAHMCAQS